MANYITSDGKTRQNLITLAEQRGAANERARIIARLRKQAADTRAKYNSQGGVAIGGIIDAIADLIATIPEES